MADLVDSAYFYSHVSKSSIEPRSFVWPSLKCYYDPNLLSSLSQKCFLFSLSEVAKPVSVNEMNLGAL